MEITATDLDFITPEMRAVYREATLAHLEAFAAEIGHMKDANAPWPEVRDRAYGIAHNIKGQGDSFGYPLMTGVGVSLLALLRGSETRDERVIRIAEAHLAAMRTIMGNGIEGDGGETGQALIERLSGLSAQPGG